MSVGVLPVGQDQSSTSGEMKAVMGMLLCFGFTGEILSCTTAILEELKLAEELFRVPQVHSNSTNGATLP